MWSSTRACALDGDAATAESYFTRLNDSPRGPVVRSFGRYLDVLVRCDGRRLAHSRAPPRP